MNNKSVQNAKLDSFSSLRAKRSNLYVSSKKTCRVAIVPRNDREAGNALWFILIAILLLGLLTSMLTRTGGGTNETGNYEQLSIQANDILQYASSIENGVQSLLARGCSENEISFENNVVPDYTNPNAPADNSCHLFETQGAGLSYIEPDKKWLDNTGSTKDYFNEIIFTGKSCVNNVGSIDTTANCATDSITSNDDVLMILPFIQEGICAIINRQSGINDIPEDNGSMWPNISPKFTGTILASNNIGIVASGSSLNGQSTGCAEVTATNEEGFHFYHVLHAR